MDQLLPSITDKVLTHMASGSSKTVCIGSRVRIYGLESAAGRGLNGQLGTVTCFDEVKQRFGVAVDGKKSSLSIAELNLVAICKGSTASLSAPSSMRQDPSLARSSGQSSFSKPDHYPVTRALGSNLSDEELHMQTVIELSLLDANVPGVSAPPELNVNAQISDALLRDRTMQSTPPQVILLAMSRHPKTLRDALLQAPSLQDCRRDLEEQGLRVEMD